MHYITLHEHAEKSLAERKRSKSGEWRCSRSERLICRNPSPVQLLSRDLVRILIETLA
eukprot:SAG22_NODE_284_length_13033_cov_21.541828_4_plen_58_part_00